MTRRPSWRLHLHSQDIGKASAGCSAPQGLWLGATLFHLGTALPYLDDALSHLGAALLRLDDAFPCLGAALPTRYGAVTRKWDLASGKI